MCFCVCCVCARARIKCMLVLCPMDQFTHNSTQQNNADIKYYKHARHTFWMVLMLFMDVASDLFIAFLHSISTKGKIHVNDFRDDCVEWILRWVCQCAMCTHSIEISHFRLNKWCPACRHTLYLRTAVRVQLKLNVVLSKYFVKFRVGCTFNFGVHILTRRKTALFPR